MDSERILGGIWLNFVWMLDCFLKVFCMVFQGQEVQVSLPRSRSPRVIYVFQCLSTADAYDAYMCTDYDLLRATHTLGVSSDLFCHWYFEKASLGF